MHNRTPNSRPKCSSLSSHTITKHLKASWLMERLFDAHITTWIQIRPQHTTAKSLVGFVISSQAKVDANLFSSCFAKDLSSKEVWSKKFWNKEP